MKFQRYVDTALTGTIVEKMVKNIRASTPISYCILAQLTQNIVM
jgi:hypothetical protein